jgi:hypothetical protein
MSSPTESNPRRWLLCTCRGRLQHLRAHLPTWLEQMPDWHPVVVCCDDAQAFEFAADELQKAGRGFALWLEQGPQFNKIEALRAGLLVIASGLEPKGQAFTVRPPVTMDDVRGNDQVAIWDADTLAMRTTERALAAIDPAEVAVVNRGSRDDLGFLAAPFRLLVAAFGLIPPGQFEGWGPEDCAIRVAVWYYYRRPFRLVRPCWARAQHQDALRGRFQALNLASSAWANGQALAALAARLLTPEERAQCEQDCHWRETFTAAKGGRRAS